MDFNDFYTVFGEELDVVYDNKLINRIIRNRRIFEDELFIDRSLKALGIKRRQSKANILQLELTAEADGHGIAHKLYPPHSNTDLERLHQSVIQSDHPDHQKQSIIYYLLKGLPEHEQILTADDFASQCYLPEKCEYLIIRPVLRIPDDFISLYDVLDLLLRNTHKKPVIC